MRDFCIPQFEWNDSFSLDFADEAAVTISVMVAYVAMGYKKDIFGSFAYEFELSQF